MSTCTEGYNNMRSERRYAVSSKTVLCQREVSPKHQHDGHRRERGITRERMTSQDLGV